MEEEKQSRALEICSLVFGIISLCGCCYGLFAIVGLVLSIIAIKKGQKSGLSIAGLVCSILGLLIAIGSAVFMLSPTGQEMMQQYFQAIQQK